MNTEQYIFVSRPLQPESASQLQLLQQEYAAIPSFEPVEKPHLTIFNSQTWQTVHPSRLKYVIDGAPKVSRTTFEDEIVEAVLTPRVRGLSRFAIRLILDDEADTRYRNEHKFYKKAFEKIDPTLRSRQFVSPHVTIGYLNTEDAIDSIMDSAKLLVGAPLHMGTVESNVGNVTVPEPRTYVKQKPRKIEYEPVRTITPGGIPQGLLASIRPNDQDI